MLADPYHLRTLGGVLPGSIKAAFTLAVIFLIHPTYLSLFRYSSHLILGSLFRFRSLRRLFVFSRSCLSSKFARPSRQPPRHFGSGSAKKDSITSPIVANGKFSRFFCRTLSEKRNQLPEAAVLLSRTDIQAVRTIPITLPRFAQHTAGSLHFSYHLCPEVASRHTNEYTGRIPD